MEKTKISAFVITTMLLMVSFTLTVSNEAKAEFMIPVPNTGLSISFQPYDVAWDDTGNMAVVVGYDSGGGPNAYYYWPNNETWTPISGAPNNQFLEGVTYWKEPTGETGGETILPNVLLVDADAYNTTWKYYTWSLLNTSAVNIDHWDVYGNLGGTPQGKPLEADMSTYDAVFWVCTFDMWAPTGMPWDASDENEVSLYLQNAGGAFMMSNIYVSDYFSYSTGMPYDYQSGDFAYDYLGIDQIINPSLNYEFYVEPHMSDTLFNGMGNEFFDWSRGNWGGPPSECDGVSAAPHGTISFLNWDMAAMFEYSAVRVQGDPFKTLFLGYPFETLPTAYADLLINLTVSWFCPDPNEPLQMDLYPEMDTTIYSDGPNISNGYGDYIFAGRTLAGGIRRSLLTFNIGGNIPAGSTITDVTLTLFCSRSGPSAGNEQISLYRLTKYWGEQPSHAPGEEGGGTIAQPDDATWSYNYNSWDTWSIPGGDFLPLPSGVATVGPVGAYYNWSSPSMISDVQSWLDTGYNYGWILRGNEGTSGATKRFNSRHYVPVNERPVLTINYVAPEVVTLSCSMDTTLFSESPNLSNGAGENLFVGRTSSAIRRGLVRFDLSSIPAGATIKNVELQLYCNQESMGDSSSDIIYLFRLLEDWGEAGSNNYWGTGAPAQINDATWNYNFYNYNTWSSLGGYYFGSYSNYQWVTSAGSTYSWNSIMMTADVQGWLDNPGSNYGWILRGSEGTPQTGKRFSSRENSIEGQRPKLIVTYDTLTRANINPDKDTGIFMENPNNSNAQGDKLRTGTNNAGFTRRSLLSFNISSSIPAGSTITNVQLKLYCNNEAGSGPETVGLYSIMMNWGEGSSNDGSMTGGAPATASDATWDYAWFSAIPWGTPGGAILPTPSSATIVENPGLFYTWSSSTMVTEVQNWLDNPSTNYGWMLIGRESGSRTIKSFCSREYPTVVYRPQLIVMYDAPPEPAVTVGDFWIVGDEAGGAAPSTVYRIDPEVSLALQPMGIMWPFTSVACDDVGNPLCVGYGLGSMYMYNTTTSSWLTIGSGLNSHYFNGVDYNPNDKRFYAVGEYFNGIDWVGTCWFTEEGPLYDGASVYKDLGSYPATHDSFSSIAWNPTTNYGLVSGLGGVHLAYPFDGNWGSQSLNWTEKANVPGNNYMDVSWDTDGYNEGAIVGYDGSGRGTYWRYYHSNPQVILGHVDASYIFECCDFKPPSSPKWLFIPTSIGGWRANVEENDQSSEIVLNPGLPHIFAINFWKQSDFLKTPLLDTQVDTDTTFTFMFAGNYTYGGVDHWDDCNLEITGWFDNGWTGSSSSPGAAIWALEDYRTRAFNITVDLSAETANVNYPSGFPEEFVVDSLYIDPNTFGIDNSRRRVYVNITFKAQTLAAPGDGMWNPPVVNNIYDKNFALNDANSWDVQMKLYDTIQPGNYNVTYHEFGVKETVSVSVSGAPGGSVPPGSVDTPLSNPSVITYSSNTLYWVNVSIPELYKDGIPGPDFIPATGVSVRNDHPLANSGNSDLSIRQYFAGANAHRCIWGISGPLMPVVPTYNGTISAGPENSDYSAALNGLPDTTSVYWWVSVPPGLPEGVYRGTITITIEDW